MSDFQIDDLFNFNASEKEVRKYYADNLLYKWSENNKYPLKIMVHGLIFSDSFVLPFIDLLISENIKYKLYIYQNTFRSISKEEKKVLVTHIERTTKFEFIEKIKGNYDIIFSNFALHFMQNWRKETSKLFSTLRNGGCFLYPEIIGDFEILDGYFRKKEFLFSESKEKYKKLKVLMEKYHKDRMEEEFYWRPEIRSTNYNFLRTEIYKCFTSYNSSSKNKIKDKPFLGFEHKDLSIKHIEKWIKKEKLAYFKSAKLEIFRKAREELKLSRNQKFTLKKSYRINIASGFKKDFFKNTFDWTSDNFLYKLQDINNNNFGQIGRKVMDLLLTHDTFIPDLTKSMMLVGWDDDENNRLDPTIVASNTKDKENDKQFLDYLLLNSRYKYKVKNKDEAVTINELLISNLKYKSNLHFSSKKNETFSSGEKFKIKYSLKDKIYEIEVDLEYNDQSEIQAMSIVIPKSKKSLGGDDSKNKELAKKDAKSLSNIEIEWPKVYGRHLKIRKPFPNKKKKDKIHLKSRKLKYYKIGKIKQKSRQELEFSYTDIQLIGENIFFEHCLLKNEKEQKDLNPLKFIFGCLLLAQCFELEKNILSIFPSSVIESNDPQIGVKGIGGIFILEKYPSFKKRSLRSLVKIRNRNLHKACNMLFYKTSIAAQMNKDFIQKSLMAAVSGIIARNGSHGLGSHVLPRAAHYSQNPTDNKLLFNYIEQRLDFIAQATSEFPSWTFPTQFNSDLMMRFYLQRNILNNLIKSEGLSAYEFDLKNTSEYIWKKDDSLQSNSPIVNSNETSRISVRGFLKEVDKRNRILIVSENHPDIDDKRILKCQFQNTLPEAISDQKYAAIRLIGRRSNLPKLDLEDCILIEHKLIIKIRKRSFLQFRDSNDQPIKKLEKLELRSNLALPHSKYRSSNNSFDVGKKREDFYDEKMDQEIMIYGVIKAKNEAFDCITLLSALQNACLDCHFEPSELDRYQLVQEYLNVGRRCLIKGVIRQNMDTNAYELFNCEVLEIVWIQHLVTAKVDSNPKDKLNMDIAVAIPGGVIGYQAFYTILENIIRNTAKHAWTKLTEAEKIGQNIEIKIEIEEIEGVDYLLCRIWSTIGNLRKDNSTDRDNEIVMERDSDDKFLNHQLSSFFNNKLTKSRGNVNKEHLGMSEMKIAAGYLSNQTIKTIGGYSKNDILLGNYKEENAGFIRASSIWEAHGKELIPRLGFKFKLNKPKDLVVISNSMEDDEIENRAKGIHVLQPEDILKESINLDFGFCVLNPKEFSSEGTPSIFTIIKKIVTDVKSLSDKKFVEEFDVFLREIEFLPFRAFVIIGNKDFKKDLRTQIHDNDLHFISARLAFISEDEFNSFKGENLILNLYDKWLYFLQTNKERYELNVNLGLNEKGFKKDMYYDRSTLESTARLFKEFIIEEFCQKTEIGAGIKVRLLNYKFETGKATSRYGFLYNWLSSASEEKFDLLYPKFKEIFDYYFKLHERIFNKEISSVETLPPIFRPNTNKPKDDKEEDHKVEQIDFESIHCFGDDKSRIHQIIDEPSKNKIAYIRHSPDNKEDFFYKDYLSGSQIFFSILKEAPNPKINRFGYNLLIRQLYENAYPKIMIIDERVNEYVSQSNFRKRLANVNIIVPSTIEYKENGVTKNIYKENVDTDSEIVETTNGIEVSIKFNGCQNTLPEKVKETKVYQHRINVFVIHNTILETIFEKKALDSFVKKMQCTHAPCFLVTSGKGKPANMSKYVKFLPFSNVENFILQPHPEKFLFTQILFKIINNRSS